MDCSNISFFFFSSRRRHTRYWRDWSSDVCSSDLRSLDLQEIDAGELDGIMSNLESATDAPFRKLKEDLDARLERKFGVETVMPWQIGRASCRERGVDLGGRRIIKKKNSDVICKNI